MSLTLYAHPFSSYCQKVLVALYENDVPFEYRTLEDPSAMTELKARWPFARFPILVDDGDTIVESTIIIEHLMLTRGGRVRWLPDDPLEALEVRFLDRFFDNDVMTAMQKPVLAALRQDGARRDEALAETQQALELAMIENLQRADLNPMEEAKGYVRLAKEFSMKQEEIATRVGKSRASVANAMRLLLNVAAAQEGRRAILDIEEPR